MTRRGKITIVLVAVAFCGVGFLGWRVYRSEPVYKGKPLSAWAQQYGSNNWSANEGPAREAELAIRHIGSEAVPFLLDQMRSEESRTKKKLRELLPVKWHNKLPLKDTSGDARRMGAHGIAALGTNAPP